MPSGEDLAISSLLPSNRRHTDDISSSDGNVSQYQKMNKMLEDIRDIFITEENTNAASIEMKSLQEPAAFRTPPANSSLPTNMSSRRAPVLSVPMDPSLNTVYRNYENLWNATIDVMSESFEELEREIEAEIQAEKNRSMDELNLSDVSLELVGDESQEDVNN